MGVVLYECLAGKPPFLAEAPLAIAYKHVHEQAPPIQRSELPPALMSILRKSLAKKKEDRYSSAEQMLEALDQLGERNRSPSSGLPVLPAETNLRTGRDRRLVDRRRVEDRRRESRRGEDPDSESGVGGVSHKSLLWIALGVLALVLATFLLVAWFVLFKA
jgi:serine/threonine protein kinase